MTAQSRRQIRSLLEQHGIHPRQSLGQNFLADPNVIDRVVRTAEVGAGERVLEVGAGTGTLTRALAGAGAARIIAVEFDRRLTPILTPQVAGLPVEVVWADALDVDYQALLQPPGWKAVANLPYHVGTPLLLDWLRLVPALVDITVMVQLEVAERLLARRGDAAYGLPSVIVALHAEARLAFRVPPQVFYPAPRVESAVVRLRRRPPAAGTERAIGLAAAGFGHRRKMLRGALGDELTDPEASLHAAGIDPRLRAEDLTADDYLRLAEHA